MADYLAQGNKTVYCKDGHINIIPFQTTIFKCSTCGSNAAVSFFGVIKDKHGNYIY